MTKSVLSISGTPRDLDGRVPTLAAISSAASIAELPGRPWVGMGVRGRSAFGAAGQGGRRHLALA